MRLIGLAVVLILSTLAPLIAEAQTGNVYRIGFLALPAVADFAELAAAFRHRLRDLGYEEGKNISFEYQRRNVMRMLDGLSRGRQTGRPHQVTAISNVATREVWACSSQS